MNAPLNAATIGLFMLVVFPGLISTAVYRLIMPAKGVEWGNALLQGLFYSTVNFVLTAPLVFPLVIGRDPLQFPVRYSLASVLALLVMPVIWPILLVRIFKSKWVARRVQIPYPTAWDFYFDQREASFVLVHLANGALLGGFWGSRSYAGSFPRDGDIYLEAVYSVDESGHFGAPIEDSRGVLLTKDQYTYLELFSVPEEEGDSGEE
jgi:hypothetical protein